MTPYDEIAEVAVTYVTGMARGDGDALRRAFHPRACSVGNFDGALEWAGLDEFIGMCEAEAIAAEAPVPPHVIESISVAGDTAMVRVTNVWADFNFRDTLSLLHLDGRWQIVGKVFQHLPAR